MSESNKCFKYYKPNSDPIRKDLRYLSSLKTEKRKGAKSLGQWSIYAFKFDL